MKFADRSEDGLIDFNEFVHSMVHDLKTHQVT